MFLAWWISGLLARREASRKRLWRRSWKTQKNLAESISWSHSPHGPAPRCRRMVAAAVKPRIVTEKHFRYFENTLEPKSQIRNDQPVIVQLWNVSALSTLSRSIIVLNGAQLDSFTLRTSQVMSSCKPSFPETATLLTSTTHRLVAGPERWWSVVFCTAWARLKNFKMVLRDDQNALVDNIEQGNCQPNVRHRVNEIDGDTAAAWFESIFPAGIYLKNSKLACIADNKFERDITWHLESKDQRCTIENSSPWMVATAKMNLHLRYWNSK